jgi:hypothetical protein
MRVFIIERNEEMLMMPLLTNLAAGVHLFAVLKLAKAIRAYASFTLAGASIAKSLW